MRRVLLACLIPAFAACHDDQFECGINLNEQTVSRCGQNEICVCGERQRCATNDETCESKLAWVFPDQAWPWKDKPERCVPSSLLNATVDSGQVCPYETALRPECGKEGLACAAGESCLCGDVPRCVKPTPPGRCAGGLTYSFDGRCVEGVDATHLAQHAPDDQGICAEFRLPAATCGTRGADGSLLSCSGENTACDCATNRCMRAQRSSGCTGGWVWEVDGRCVLAKVTADECLTGLRDTRTGACVDATWMGDPDALVARSLLRASSGLCEGPLPAERPCGVPGGAQCAVDEHCLCGSEPRCVRVASGAVCPVRYAADGACAQVREEDLSRLVPDESDGLCTEAKLFQRQCGHAAADGSPVPCDEGQTCLCGLGLCAQEISTSTCASGFAMANGRCVEMPAECPTGYAWLATGTCLEPKAETLKQTVAAEKLVPGRAYCQGLEPSCGTAESDRACPSGSRCLCGGVNRCVGKVPASVCPSLYVFHDSGLCVPPPALAPAPRWPPPVESEPPLLPADKTVCEEWELP